MRETLEAAASARYQPPEPKSPTWTLCFEIVTGIWIVVHPGDSRAVATGISSSF